MGVVGSASYWNASIYQIAAFWINLVHFALINLVEPSQLIEPAPRSPGTALRPGHIPKSLAAIANLKNFCDRTLIAGIISKLST
jgi:hypothetical protein